MFSAAPDCREMQFVLVDSTPLAVAGRYPVGRYEIRLNFSPVESKNLAAPTEIQLVSDDYSSPTDAAARHPEIQLVPEGPPVDY